MSHGRMHELGLATRIHRTCRRGLAPGARLERVRVAVGELAAVEPALLRFAWSAVVADGDDAAAVLEIDWRRALQRCAGCGAVAARDGMDWARACARCGGTLAIEGGCDLDVLGFDYLAAGAEEAG